MKKYKFVGQITVYISGIGEIEPGQSFETDIEINNPDFELITDEDQPRKPKKEESKED